LDLSLIDNIHFDFEGVEMRGVGVAIVTVVFGFLVVLFFHFIWVNVCLPQAQVHSEILHYMLFSL